MLLQFQGALARAQGKRLTLNHLELLGVPNSLPGSAGVPPAPSLAQPRPSPPLGSTGNGAMALLRPGRCGSRRQGGCLRHRTEAQRQPKGQHAGGTPALPGKAVPAERVAACGIALKLSGSQRDSMRAGRPRSRARLFPRQGGCLRHCTEAQRQPKGQHAGGTPALPGKAKTGNMVYTFHQCIIHSLRGSSWITLFSPSRPLADPYRSSSNPFVDIFFCLRHGLATSLPTEPAGCGASG